MRVPNLLRPALWALLPALVLAIACDTTSSSDSTAQPVEGGKAGAGPTADDSQPTSTQDSTAVQDDAAGDDSADDAAGDDSADDGAADDSAQDDGVTSGNSDATDAVDDSDDSDDSEPADDSDDSAADDSDVSDDGATDDGDDGAADDSDGSDDGATDDGATDDGDDGAADESAEPGDAGVGGKVVCDTRGLTCRRAPPVCEQGFVPRIVNGCYGDCVRIDECVCSSPAECPNSNEFTCRNDQQRCTYYLR